MLGTFLLLVLHPYLLDFFSLARGYALGNGFLLLAAWHTLAHLKNGSLRSFTLACAAAGVAALAHLIMINFLLAFAGAWAVVLFLQRKQRPYVGRQMLILLLSTALPILLLIPNLLALYHAGSLNYGCDAFWSCSIASLMERVLYRLSSPIPPLQWAALYACCIVAVLLVAWWRRRMNSGPERDAVLLVSLMLFLCILAFMVQNWWLDVPLPRTRTALYLLPLTALLLVVALRSWHDAGRFSGPLALVLCLPLVVHFARAANVNYAVEWRSTGELRKAVDLVSAFMEQRPAGRARSNIRTCFESTGCMGYYVHARELYSLSYGQRGELAFESADLYLVEEDAHHLVDTVNWSLMARWAATDLALYRDKRAQRPFTQLLYSERFTEGDHAAGVFPTLSWTVQDTLGPPPYLLAGHIDATEHGNANWIGHIMEVWRDGHIIAQESVPSHLQIGDYGHQQRTGVELLFMRQLLTGDSIRYRAWPFIPSPPIELGTAEIRVLR
jgi:hypothetical protein